MNKKTIAIVGGIALAFVALWWFGARSQAALPDARQAQSTSGLSAAESSFDFGTISMKNGKVSKSFRISNLTPADITLESVTTSCMCTAAYIVDGETRKGPFGMPGHNLVPKANDLVRAGETRDIEVVYDPNAHGPAGVGPVDRAVFLKDGNGGLLQLRIKAVVTP